MFIPESEQRLLKANVAKCIHFAHKCNTHYAWSKYIQQGREWEERRKDDASTASHLLKGQRQRKRHLVARCSVPVSSSSLFCKEDKEENRVYKKKSLLSALHRGRFTSRSHCFVNSLSFAFFVMFWVYISLFLFYNLGFLIVGHVLIYLLSLVFLVWYEFMSFWVFDFSCHFMTRLVRSFSFVI